MKHYTVKQTFFSIFVLIFMACISVQAFTQSPLIIYGLKGPSGIGMIQIFEEPPSIPGFSVKVEALAQADLMAAKFIAVEAKVGILPPNVAAKIASTGKKVQIAAVLGNGMLSLLSSEPDVKGIEDLKGKTVAVAGQGATPDYVFRRLLITKGLNPEKDVILNYSLAPAEIAQTLIAGRISTAILPEPFATMALSGRQSLRQIGDVQEEWVRSGGNANYPMTVLVVDSDFARSRPDALQIIMKSFRYSIEWVVSHPAQAGVLTEKHELGLRAAVVNASIPRSNFVFIPAMQAKPALEALFKTFLEFSPVSIGGALPPDSFYLH